CASPNGDVMVQELHSTNTQGFVARDDTKKEIVVAWRGRCVSVSTMLQDHLYSCAFAPLMRIPMSVAGATVHSGFIRSYNSVADQVVALVKTQLDQNPEYAVMSTGRRLGGSLASLAGVSLKSNFPNTLMRLYIRPAPYGQPGIREHGQLAFGDQSFRPFVHSPRTLPTVPTASLMLFGFRHQGVEYWQTSDPAVAEMLEQCAPDGENPTCSDSESSPPLILRCVHSIISLASLTD
ncbi:Alpha/Beta hydrolase protein, partial [Mycena haematopus]